MMWVWLIVGALAVLVLEQRQGYHARFFPLFPLGTVFTLALALPFDLLSPLEVLRGVRLDKVEFRHRPLSSYAT